jgi:hypothetical protein
VSVYWIFRREETGEISSTCVAPDEEYRDAVLRENPTYEAVPLYTGDEIGKRSTASQILSHLAPDQLWEVFQEVEKKKLIGPWEINWTQPKGYEERWRACPRNSRPYRVYCTAKKRIWRIKDWHERQRGGDYETAEEAMKAADRMLVEGGYTLVNFEKQVEDEGEARSRAKRLQERSVG